MVDLAAVFHDLVRVETIVWNRVDARLRETCELSLARFATMQVLHRRGSCRVLDVADELAISWGGASKIVDRVEAAGHCRRRPNPDDARSSLITLTRPGRSRLTSATEVFEDELAEHLAAALTASQLDQLARALCRVRSHVHPSADETLFRQRLR